MVVVLRFDPMLLITILLPVGDKAKDRLGVTGSQASATLPHRKISGSPDSSRGASLRLWLYSQLPERPTSTTYPTPTASAPSAFSLLGPTKEAHIPQLFSWLYSWLKFIPWEIQRGGWLLLECVWLGPSVPAQTVGSAGAVKRAGSQGNPESPAPSCAREWNVLLWVLKQTQPRRGSGVAGSWRSWGQLHKAASVPLQAEPTSSGVGVGRPLLSAQWLRRSWS